MNRREFLRTSSGLAAATAATVASGTAAAQDEGGDGGGGGGGGGTQEVTVGPGGDTVFQPGTDQPLAIAPGTTVLFVWDSNTHNIAVDSQPDEANWEGHESIEDSGFEYEHTFDVEGTYEYHCDPHVAAGMEATIEVTPNPQEAAGGEEGGHVDPSHFGVPIREHFVGIATILMMNVSLLFTFFLLKYGESSHSSSPNR